MGLLVEIRQISVRVVTWLVIATFKPIVTWWLKTWHRIFFFAPYNFHSFFFRNLFLWHFGAFTSKPILIKFVLKIAENFYKKKLRVHSHFEVQHLAFSFGFLAWHDHHVYSIGICANSNLKIWFLQSERKKTNIFKINSVYKIL